MKPSGAPLAALAGGLKDVLGGSLGLLALLCLLSTVIVTFGAAWGLYHLVAPWIEARDWSVPIFRWDLDADAVLSFLAGVGIVIMAIVLAPAVSIFIGGFLFDIACERVEKSINAPPGRMVPIKEGVANGLRVALPALGLNIIAIPLYFIPVVNLVAFLWLNGYLMGREYAALVAVRRMTWEEARRFRRHAPVGVFLIGLACSVIPFVAPLVGASAMTRFVVARVAATQGASA